MPSRTKSSVAKAPRKTNVPKITKSDPPPPNSRGSASLFSSSNFKVSNTTPSIGSNTTIRRIAPMFGNTTSGEAPAAVSQWHGPRYSFLPSSEKGALRIHFIQPLCYLINANASGAFQGQAGPFRFQADPGTGTFTQTDIATVMMTPGTIGAAKATSTTQWTQYQVIPDSIFLQILASAFSKYRVSDMKLHYMPTCPTSYDAQVALAFATDVDHPVLGLRSYYTGGGAIPPNFNTIKLSSNSVVFAGWLPWSAEFICEKHQEYYTFNNTKADRGISTSLTSIPSMQDRWSYFGCISGAASGVNTGTLGELFWEQTVELSDFSPITLTASTLGRMMLNDLMKGFMKVADTPSPQLVLESKDSKSEEDDDDGELVNSTNPYHGLSSGTDRVIVRGPASSHTESQSSIPQRLSKSPASIASVR